MAVYVNNLNYILPAVIQQLALLYWDIAVAGNCIIQTHFVFNFVQLIQFRSISSRLFFQIYDLDRVLVYCSVYQLVNVIKAYVSRNVILSMYEIKKWNYDR